MISQQNKDKSMLKATFNNKWNVTNLCQNMSHNCGMELLKCLFKLAYHLLLHCGSVQCSIEYFTDLGSLIEIHNVEISWFFWHSNFMWNQFWSFWSFKNCHLDRLISSEFWIFENWRHFKVWNFSKNQNSKPPKCENGNFWPTEIS